MTTVSICRAVDARGDWGMIVHRCFCCCCCCDILSHSLFFVCLFVSFSRRFVSAGLYPVLGGIVAFLFWTDT